MRKVRFRQAFFLGHRASTWGHSDSWQINQILRHKISPENTQSGWGEWLAGHRTESDKKRRSLWRLEVGTPATGKGIPATKIPQTKVRKGWHCFIGFSTCPLARTSHSSHQNLYAKLYWMGLKGWTNEIAEFPELRDNTGCGASPTLSNLLQNPPIKLHLYSRIWKRNAQKDW
jgi:hypothetical protein